MKRIIMKWGFFSVLMLMLSLLHAQEGKGTIKALYEEDGKTMLTLQILNISRPQQLEQISSEVVLSTTYKLLGSKIDRSKKIAELFIVSTEQVTIDDIEELILSMKIKEVKYNETVIQTKMLSDVYEAVVPVEFIRITRN